MPIVHLFVLLDRSGLHGLHGRAGRRRLQPAAGRAAGRRPRRPHDARPVRQRGPAGGPRRRRPDRRGGAARPRTPSSPAACTPLLDATGRLIGKAAGRAATWPRRRPAEQVLFVTITDGEENQSHEFSRQQIVDLVRAKEDAGWTFVFLGAGLDAYREAGGLGYAARSVQSFAPDGTGADLAFSSLSRQDQRLPRQASRWPRPSTGRLLRGRQAGRSRPPPASRREVGRSAKSCRWRHVCAHSGRTSRP